MFQYCFYVTLTLTLKHYYVSFITVTHREPYKPQHIEPPWGASPMDLRDWLLRHPRYCLENFYSVKPKLARGGSPVVPFVLKHNQKKILGKFVRRFFGIHKTDNPNEWHSPPRPSRDIKLKYRQGGMSTIDAGIRTHVGRFSPGGDSVFVTGHADSSTKNVYGYYRRFENLLQKGITRGTLDSGLHVPVISYREDRLPGSATELTWSVPMDQEHDPSTDGWTVQWDDSVGAGIYSNMADFASFSGRHFHATECGRRRAHNSDPWEVVLENTQQCIPEEPGTSISLEGTAETASGFFFEEWYKAVEGKTLFEPFFFPFFTDEDCLIELTQDEKERIAAGDWRIAQPIEGSPQEQADDERELERIRTAIDEYEAWGIAKLLRRENRDRFKKRLIFLIEMRESALKWRQAVGLKRCQGNPMAFRRQYPTVSDDPFTTTGNCVFNEGLISHHTQRLEKAAQERAEKPTKYPYSFDTSYADDDEFAQKNVTIFYPPSPKTEYWIIHDPSRGLQEGNPASTLVWNVDQWRKDAGWYGWRDPRRQASDLAWLGRYYVTNGLRDGENLVGGSDSEICVEATGGIGRQINDALEEMGYYALYQHLSGRGASSEFGFQMTQTHRDKGITALQMCMRDLNIDDINDWREFRQFGEVITRNGNSKVKGMNNSTDDRVMDYVMLAFILQERNYIAVPESGIDAELEIPSVSPLPEEPPPPKPVIERTSYRRPRVVGERKDWRLGFMGRRERERLQN